VRRFGAGRVHASEQTGDPATAQAPEEALRHIRAGQPEWHQLLVVFGVRLVISDQHAGLVAALRRSFQGANSRYASRQTATDDQLEARTADERMVQGELLSE
jgi:hypothetical protein